MKQDLEIISLNMDDLDIEELERRLELAFGAAITPDGWVCANDCGPRCPVLCEPLCVAQCPEFIPCGAACPGLCDSNCPILCDGNCPTVCPRYVIP